MTAAVKAVASVLIAILAAMAVERLAIEPYRCNRTLKRAEERTKIAVMASDPVRIAALTRDSIEELESCRAHMPDQVEIPMVIAGNYWIRGELAKARDEYRRALTINPRPEIYLNIGLVEIDMKDPRAMDDLVTAVLFQPLLLYSMHDELQLQVLARIKATQPAAR